MNVTKQIEQLFFDRHGRARARVFVPALSPAAITHLIAQAVALSDAELVKKIEELRANYGEGCIYDSRLISELTWRSFKRGAHRGAT